MEYIDVHCHLNCPEYDTDREEVIARAQAGEIGVINVGTDILMSQKAIEIARAHKNMWATVGVHPTHTAENNNFSLIEKLAEDPKVVAIGECGLDFFRSVPEEFETQRAIFLQHIELANRVNKPLMLHVRNGKDNLGVYGEAIEMLKKHSKVRANFHFFAGTIEDLKMILDIDGTVSFTGVVTFTRSYDEIIKYVPIDHIMSETDAPYVAPAPFRGKRNEPLYIKEILAGLATVRGETIEELSLHIVDKARKMFGI